MQYLKSVCVCVCVCVCLCVRAEAGTKELETVKELWGRQLRGLQSKKVPKETKSGQKGTKKAPSPTTARGPTSTRGQVNTSGHATTKASTTRPKSATRGQTSTKSTTKGSGKKSTQNEAKKGSSGKGKDKNTAERVTPVVPTRKSAVESLLAAREGSGGSEGERGEPGAGASSEGARSDLLTASKTRYFKVRVCVFVCACICLHSHVEWRKGLYCVAPLITLLNNIQTCFLFHLYKQ